MEWLESNIINIILTIVAMAAGSVAWALGGLNRRIDEERKETNRRFEAHERRFEASERRFEAHERRLDDLYSSFYGPLMRAAKDTK